MAQLSQEKNPFGDVRRIDGVRIRGSTNCSKRSLMFSKCQLTGESNVWPHGRHALSLVRRRRCSACQPVAWRDRCCAHKRPGDGWRNTVKPNRPRSIYIIAFAATQNKRTIEERSGAWCPVCFDSLIFAPSMKPMT